MSENKSTVKNINLSKAPPKIYVFYAGNVLRNLYEKMISLQALKSVPCKCKVTAEIFIP